MLSKIRKDGIAALQMTLLSIVALGIFAIISRWFENIIDTKVLVASFGATTIVLFTLRGNEPSKFYNVIMGHILAVIVGLLCRYFIVPISFDLAIVCAVAVTLGAMRFTCSAHPPGGAVAMILVLTPASVLPSPITMAIGIVLGAFTYFIITKVVVDGFQKIGIHPWDEDEEIKEQKTREESYTANLIKSPATQRD